MHDTPAIQIDNASFSYDDKAVLKDVNLRIAERDFVSIIGPNGGGKSTLLKIIMGIYEPDGGSVKVFGLVPEKARSRIGYMPQHAHHDPQFPTTVQEVVLMGRLGRRLSIGPYSKRDREQASKALKEVGIAELADSSFSSLSGGQRQRALIARALVSDPELLLLDEPTSHIDINAENELLNLLEELNEHHTILLVTHDIGFVSRKVSKVVCVNRDVVLHPTSEITGEIIHDLYGRDMKIVRHDHECSEKGHKWPSS